MHILPGPKITNPETPADHFAVWLPGEMRYSARKAGYDEKIRRARLPLDDPESMYNFLGAEWQQHRQLLKEGVHYLPFHGFSAQLQAAKLAAGLFDKAAMASWITEDTEPTTHNFADVGYWTGRWAGIMLHYDYKEYEGVAPKVTPNEFGYYSDWGDTIEDTPFGEGIREIMKSLIELDDMRGELITSDFPFTDHNQLATELGNLAAGYYISYANEYLAPHQYQLPVSKLAQE